jgi:hypothetical protein
MKFRLGEREISNAKIRLNARGLHIRMSILRLPGDLGTQWWHARTLVVADYFDIVLSKY